MIVGRSIWFANRLWTGALRTRASRSATKAGRRLDSRGAIRLFNQVQLPAVCPAAANPILQAVRAGSIFAFGQEPDGEGGREAQGRPYRVQQGLSRSDNHPMV